MPSLPQELQFLLYEVFDLESLFSRSRYEDHSRETVDAILATAKSIADMAHAGFIGASHDAEWGGIQLPELAARASTIHFNVANVSTAGYPFLTVGASNLIEAFGSQNQKERFMQAMIEGRFSGTMALTEPAQGSSLADITTVAVPQEDGSYHLKGQKIYISAGDHELTENIVHMVLAKIPGGPAGVKGISLFICPKYLVNDDGTAGERNDVALAGLLHKMGYRNTTSTVLSFGEKDNCKAYLLGEAHKGLSYMFQMMNEARIGVGLGAACLGYAGYSYSVEFARERRQGRHATNKDPESPQVAIIEHADVRRMLLAQKSYVEGSIALCLLASRLVDDEKTLTDDVEKQKAFELLDYLTPVVKSWSSKYGVKANDLAIQVLGGSGYIREYPVEQYYRDNRLNPIHEGTEGIQGLDLLGRKTTLGNGQLYKSFLTAVQETIAEAKEEKNLEDFVGALVAYVGLHQETTVAVTSAMREDVNLALANATEYLDFTGKLVLAWVWLKLSIAAQKGLEQNPSEMDKNFYLGKLQAAKYHFEWELPEMQSQAELLKSLNRTPFDMQDDWF